jgi:hypothetical protein
LSVRFKNAPSENWQKEEELHYGGWLLQWFPVPSLLIGGYLTSVRAETDVQAESSFATTPTQRRVEQTTTVGLEAGWRLYQRFEAHLWLEYVRRPEERILLSPSQPDSLGISRVSRSVRHRDRERFFALQLRWNLSTRWQIQGSYLAATRNASGLPQATFHRSHHRLQSSLTLYFTPQTRATLGVNWELDAKRGKGESAFYDGGFFQWVAWW